MENFARILDNRILLAAFLGWAIAQAIKVLATLISTRKFDFDRLMGTGGMPSSHSATVIAASVAIGQILGYDSPLFGLSLVHSFIVMYDACGIRRAAGKQAAILNNLVEELRLHKTINYPKKLKELLGHTYSEVFVGGILGAVIAIWVTL